MEIRSERTLILLNDEVQPLYVRNGVLWPLQPIVASLGEEKSIYTRIIALSISTTLYTVGLSTGSAMGAGGEKLHW